MTNNLFDRRTRVDDSRYYSERAPRTKLQFYDLITRRKYITKNIAVVEQLLKIAPASGGERKSNEKKGRFAPERRFCRNRVCDTATARQRNFNTDIIA